MVIGSGRRDVVCGFLGKYGGELRVFRGEDGFWFRCFSGSGEFGGGGEAGDDRGAHGNKAGTASNNSVEGSVFSCSVDVCGFFLPLIIFEESRICDSVYVYVARGTSWGFKERVVSLIVDFVGGEKKF